MDSCYSTHGKKSEPFSRMATGREPIPNREPWSKTLSRNRTRGAPRLEEDVDSEEGGQSGCTTSARPPPSSALSRRTSALLAVADLSSEEHAERWGAVLLQ